MILKIVSLNIDSLSLNRKSEYFWCNRKQFVLEMLSDIKPTIFCLQEACEQNIADIINGLDYEFNYYLGEASLNSSIFIYNPIFWSNDYNLLKNGCICLSTNLGKDGDSWDSESERSLTWVMLLNKYTHHRILIFNTHLDNKGEVARINSSKLIIKYIKQLTSMYCCDAILIGDFNSRPWYPLNEEQSSYGKHIIPGCLPTDNIYSIYIDAGFIDSFMAVNNTESLTTNTYHDYLGNIFPNVALRIDWQMLYKCEHSQNSICTYSLYMNKILSDHYPLVCEYQITTSLEDALYSGKNPAIRMCEFGYALRHISNFIREVLY